MASTNSIDEAWLADPESASPRPSRLGVGQAIRRQPLAFAAPIVILLAIALAYGLAREPKYTAQARLGVARIDVSAPGALAGFAVAAQALAEAYARAISAEPVTAAVARGAGSDKESVRTDVSAAPIPDTPVFQIKAKSKDPRQAQRLANVASTELVRYIVDLNRTSPDSARLFARFRRQSLELNRARAEKEKLERLNKDSPSDARTSQLVDARTRFENSQLRVDSLRDAYQASQQGQASTSLLQILAKASSASSDRRKQLEIVLFVALAAGIALGTALALLLSAGAARRTLP